MSNSDELRVSLIEEVSPGTTPASPAMLVLPTTGQDVTDLVRYIESNTITSKRNVKDLARVSRSSGGNLPAELMWAATTEALYHAIRATLCCQAEDAEVTFSSASISAGLNTITRASGDFTAGGAFKVDDVIKVSLASASDDGYRVITAVSALSMTVGGAPWVNTVSGSVALKRGARMDNGTWHRYFSVAVDKLDIGKYHLFKKQVFNTMDVGISVGSISNMSFGVTGGLSTTSSSPISGATYTDPAARRVMDAIAVPLILVGGVSYEMADMRMQMNNNAQAREKIGTDSVGTIRKGKFRVSGSARWYLDGFTEYDKFVNNQTTSLVMVNEDDTGAAWSWHCPKAKWSNVRQPTTGPNSDDYVQADFTALEANATGYTIRCQRFS